MTTVYDEIQIYIPSYQRAHRQTTIDDLVVRKSGNPVLCDVVLAVREDEADEYDYWTQHGVDMLILPDYVENIAQTHVEIMKDATAKYVGIFDDDIRFYRRISPDPSETALRQTQYEDQMLMLSSVLEEFKNPAVAQVGISMREGNNFIHTEVKSNARCIRAVFFDTEKLKVHDITHRTYFDPMDDFDITLQILNAGLENRIICMFAQNQMGSNVHGGCSTYRTDEYQTRTSERLAEAWPWIVKTVERQTKGAWGGGTRKDVRILWKQAFEAGMEVKTDKELREDDGKRENTIQSQTDSTQLV